MGARLKKTLWFLFFFVAYIVIRGGIEIVFERDLWNLGRQADILIKVFTFPRSKLFRNPLKRNSSTKGAITTMLSASKQNIFICCKW